MTDSDIVTTSFNVKEHIMANPYHDAEGKFTSREGMIKAIDRLAVDGKIDEYLELRQKFEKIDAERTVILTVEEFQQLTNKTSEPAKETKTENTLTLNDLSTEALTAVANDLVHEWNASKAQGAEFNPAKFDQVLNQSNYDREVAYALIDSTSKLPSEYKIEVLEKANYLEGYAFMHNYTPDASDAKKLMEKHEQELAGAAQRMLERNDLDGYHRNRLADLLGHNSSNPEHIKLALQLTDFNATTGLPGVYIIDNPHASAPVVKEIVNNIVQANDIQTYWSARHSINKRLKAKNLQLSEAVIDEKIKPLPGSVTTEDNLKMAATQPSLDDKGRRKSQTWEQSQAYEKALTKYDSYEEQFKNLNQQLRNRKLEYMDRYALVRRKENAITYLNILQDKENVLNYLNKL